MGDWSRTLRRTGSRVTLSTLSNFELRIENYEGLGKPQNVGRGLYDNQTFLTRMPGTLAAVGPLRGPDGAPMYAMCGLGMYVPP